MNNTKEKCFVIMPISDQGDYPTGHFTKVYEQIFKPAIEKAGYEAYRVDENNICDSIIGKIFKAIQECPMALCDLSNRNPNVLYELGIRQAYDKPVVLVQDDKTERIFDVSGINTVQYKSLRLYEDVIDARNKITEAIISTKEGKQNSIVKVVSAQSAVISSSNMTKEDRIEVMLSGLIKDVIELKKRTDESSSFFNNEFIRTPNKHITSSLNEQNTRVTAVIELKQGITNAEIRRCIEPLAFELDLKIETKRNGNFLEISIEGDNDSDLSFALFNLRNKLGAIYN